EELMVDSVIDEVAELMVEVEEQMVALVVDMKEELAMLFVIKDLCTRMGNLEYGHSQPVKKVIQLSDAKVADGIAIREIIPRVSAIEGHVQVMTSQMVQVVGKLEKVGTQIEQGQQATTQQDETIEGLSQQVQTLQAAVQQRDMQIQ
nr:hypothetical protein [Tanacetum cinerariifolium]